MSDIYYYYETDSNGDQIYKKNSDGDEYYANTPNPEDIFATSKDGIIRYARDHLGNEIYPKHPLLKSDFMTTFSGLAVYAKDVSGRERYPKTAQGDEFPGLDADFKIIYACNEYSKPYYPKKKDGDEFIVDEYIKNKDGTVVYPLRKDGLPIYPIKRNSEVYHIDKKKIIVSIAKDFWGNQIYAKNESGDEYYPLNNQIAYTREHVPKYAIDRWMNTIYPKNFGGHEYYIKNVEPDSVLLGNRYVKDTDDNEIYPHNINEGQIIIGNKYAKNNMGTVEYPLDNNGNEFTISTLTLPLNEASIFPNGYPITNDGWVIVPKINDKPYLSSTMDPQIKDNNVVGLLFRHDQTNDYITNVKSSRKSKSTILTKRYRTAPIPQKRPNPPASSTIDEIKIIKSINWASALLLTTLVMAVIGIFVKFIH